MAELKTKPTGNSVESFLDGLPDPTRKKDAQTLLAIMKKATGEPPEMWGNAIIGFGRYRYPGRSGKTREWMRIGFSPRKSNLSIYIMTGANRYKPLLDQLGKHSLGASCLYVNRLDDIDLPTLRTLVARAYKDSAGLETMLQDRPK